MKPNSVLHLTANLWRRYFWEIAVFVLISLAASAWALIDLRSLPSNGFTWLELIGTFWLFTRVLLAESAFATHAGWRARPLTALQMTIARLACLASIFILPAIARVIAMQLALNPTAADWGYLIVYQWCVVIAMAAILSAALWLIERPLRDSRHGAAAGWALIAALVMLVFANQPRAAKGGGGSGGGLDLHELSSGVRALLPPSAKLIGLWGPERLWRDDKPGVRLLARVPLDQKTLQIHEGIGGQVLWYERDGSRLALRLRLIAASKKRRLLEEEDDVLPVLRFGDGSYSPLGAIDHNWQSISLPLMPVSEFVTKCDFVSPQSLPENSLDWQSLVAGAELLIFVKVKGGEAIDEIRKLPRAMSIGEEELTIQVPTLSENPDQAEFERRVQVAIDQANLGTYARGWLKGEGPKHVPAVLDRHPYSSDAWAEVAPYLSRHATEEHKPQMLALLELDPRMATVFANQGWFADALPICKKQLLEGRLPPSKIVLDLAKLRDPELAAALQREFPRIGHQVAEIGAVLRDHPGVDWSAVVKEGWKRRKYAIGEQGGSAHFANWAAQLGDASAFDRLLRDAARGNRWHQDRLGELLGDPKPRSAKVADWLRENRRHLSFDRRSAEWVLNEGSAP